MTMESIEYMLNLPRVKKAQALAEAAHNGEIRKYSGAPYVTHLQRLVRAAAMNPAIDENEIIAVWLHDHPEDHAASLAEQTAILEEIGREFGEQVKNTVRWLTSPDLAMKGVKRAIRKSVYFNSFRSAPWHVRYIKLLDRIDNLTETRDDLNADLPVPHDFVRLYLRESLDLLAVLRPTDPIAEQTLQHLIDELKAIVY